MANELTSDRTSDPRVLAAAKALHAHFSAEDSIIADFPLDEYICCAEVALKAADAAVQSTTE